MGPSTIAALLVMAACGSSGGDVADGGSVDAVARSDGRPDTGPAPTPAEAWFAAHRAAMCAYAIRCEGKTPETQAPCHPAWRNPREATLVAGLESGRTELDPVRAAACLEQLEVAARERRCLTSHDPIWETRPRPCQLDAPFRPRARIGDACSSMLGYGECDTETSRCLRAVDGTCPARCIDRGDLETACDSVLDCRLFLSCIDGRCAAGGEVGAACDQLERPCMIGLACAAGECGPEPERGDVCDDDVDCVVARLACRMGRCGDLPLAGEACDAYCADGRPCDSTTTGEGICLADAIGWPCVASSYVDHCDADTVCAPDGLGNHVCRHPVADGEACGIDVPCVAGSRCVDARCARVVGADSPCGPGTACPLSHACVAGACVSLPLEGESCEATGQCFEGSCVDGRCLRLALHAECEGTRLVPLGQCEGHCSGMELGYCQDHVALGERCYRDGECAPEAVCERVSDVERRCMTRCGT